MTFGEHPVDQAFSVLCPYEGFFLTKTGSLLGAIDLVGIDPDGETRDEATRAAIMAANIMTALPPTIDVTQYYIHMENHRVALRDRPGNPVNHRLSKDREAALNGRQLATTRLIHVFEIRDPTGLNPGSVTKLLSLLPQIPFDPHARALFLARLHAPTALLVREMDLEARARALRHVMDAVVAKWSMRMEASVLSSRETWRILKFLATCDERYLDVGTPIGVPTDDCDIALAAGDITPIAVDYTDMLRLEGAEPRYLRAASIVKTPHNPIGLWSHGPDAPLRRRGNYVAMTHFSPLSQFERSFTFRAAENRLTRIKLDFKKILMADQVEVKEAQHETIGIRKRREELERADSIEDRWGSAVSQVMLINKDPLALIEECRLMDASLTNKQAQIIWESVGLPGVYAGFQPGGQGRSLRKSIVTLSRAAAMGLTAKSSTGTRIVPDLGNEEAQYILETENGEPFYYSPFVGGRAFVIGVGPTRSGKSFFKNTLSAHFLKYGGFLRALDIDPGTETLAKFYGADGGIIRLDADGAARGLNPFVSNEGEDDRGFVSHMIMLIGEMLKANDLPEAQRLTQAEQAEFDRAIIATTRLPAPMQSLHHMLAHMAPDIRAKLSRWVAGGVYDGIFNVAEDGIGSFDKKIGVINLQAHKRTPNILRPLMLELFFRVTRLFESERYRGIPKQLDIDEAHHPLSIESFPPFLLDKVRTWAKWSAGITLWTQSPRDYLTVKGWEAIRTAASTYIFLADPEMIESLYVETFGLTPGQCAAIRSLTPRQEAFIVQPEIGVAKKVRIRVEPAQHVINTSQPQEVVKRDRLIAEHGFERGFELAIAAHEAAARADADRLRRDLQDLQAAE